MQQVYIYYFPSKIHVLYKLIHVFLLGNPGGGVIPPDLPNKSPEGGISNEDGVWKPIGNRPNIHWFFHNFREVFNWKILPKLI